MKHLEVNTIKDLQQFESFALHASVKCKQQTNYTCISILFGMLLLLQVISGYSKYEYSLLGAIIIIIAGILALMILTVQMTAAEESIREFKALTLSYMSIDSDGGCTITNTELKELSSFIKKSTRFMIIYIIVKTMNWIIFLIAAMFTLFGFIQIMSLFYR